MVTLGRKIFVPTVLLAAVVTVALAFTAWESARQASAIEHDTQAIRAATALAAALDDATEEEDRSILSIPLSAREPHEARLAETSERIAALMHAIGALQMPPRAAATWRLFVEARPALAALGSEVVTAAREGDAARLSLAVETWRLRSSRANALLLNFSSYYFRLLDRMVVELQARRARALWTAVAAVAAGLLAAVALSAAVARAVVKPIVGIASAAERVAETGRLAEVSGADRPDELGVLARSFNRMTQRLVSANAHLEEADRRKDDFLAMLSHELRNPLAPIRNALHVLAHPGADPGRTRRATAVIERQVEHLTRILDDLLDVTRIARGKIELRRALLNATALVGRVSEDYRPFMAERGLALEIEAADGAAWVDADGTRLAQVVGNLLHNAAKFTPRGGRVTVAVDAREEEVEIRVKDTGVGMDEGLLRRIFEPFVQADGSLARSSGGLGLGLALVRGVVELHGGTVLARSPGPGAGSGRRIRAREFSERGRGEAVSLVRADGTEPPSLLPVGARGDDLVFRPRDEVPPHEHRLAERDPADDQKPRALGAAETELRTAAPEVVHRVAIEGAPFQLRVAAEQKDAVLALRDRGEADARLLHELEVDPDEIGPSLRGG